MRIWESLNDLVSFIRCLGDCYELVKRSNHSKDWGLAILISFNLILDIVFRAFGFWDIRNEFQVLVVARFSIRFSLYLLLLCVSLLFFSKFFDFFFLFFLLLNILLLGLLLFAFFLLDFLLLGWLYFSFFWRTLGTFLGKCTDFLFSWLGSSCFGLSLYCFYLFRR